MITDKKPKVLTGPGVSDPVSESGPLAQWALELASSHKVESHLEAGQYYGGFTVFTETRRVKFGVYGGVLRAWVHGKGEKLKLAPKTPNYKDENLPSLEQAKAWFAALA